MECLCSKKTKSLKNNKFMQYIKSLTLYVLSCLISYFSMVEYANNLSSACMKCSYARDVILYSLYLLPLFFITIFLLKKKKKNNNLVLITVSVAFSFFIFLNNLNIFIDRVSSWSTFSSGEEIYITLQYSYSFLILGIVFFFLILKKWL